MAVKLKLLSFDLDDTLWPCRPTILAAERTLYDWMGRRVPAITHACDMEVIREKRFDYLRQHPELAHDMSRLRVESLQALAQEFSLATDWVDEAFEVFFSARQKVTLYADVAPVLDRLKQDYRLVAVSNGNADIDLTGVGHWFEFAVNAAEVGVQKPHPRVFETVLERAGVSAVETLHIGDDPHHDIYGAVQAGIRSVWVNRSEQAWQHKACRADFHIRTLTELPQVIEKLEA